MKPLKRYIAVAMVFAVLLQSCQQQVPEEISIELSDYSTIDFPSQGSEKVINVTTNATYWQAYPNASWVEIEHNLGSFLVKAQPNSTTEERKASILVHAKGTGVTQTLMVTQAAGRSALEVQKNEVKFDQIEQEKTIKVNTVSDNWSIENTAPEWITAKASVEERLLYISVKENSSTDSRSAKLFVQAGEKIEEIVVHQSGSLYYILPLLTPGSNIRDVREFELARHSLLETDDSYLKGGAHTYFTKSPVFYKVVYTFSKDIINGATLYPKDTGVLTSEGLHHFLTKEGYQAKAESQHEKVYVRHTEVGEAKYEIVANVAFAIPNTDPSIIFRIVPRQPKVMPTFEKIPLSELYIKKLNKNAVVAWESTHGGIQSRSKSKPTFLYFDIFDTTYIGRDYSFSKEGDQVTQMRAFIYDISKVFYRAGTSYLMTDEFKNLLKKEGFKFYQQTPDDFRQLYRNDEKGCIFGVRVAQVTGVNDGTPCLMFMYLPIPEQREEK